MNKKGLDLLSGLLASYRRTSTCTCTSFIFREQPIVPRAPYDGTGRLAVTLHNHACRCSAPFLVCFYIVLY